MMKLKRLYILVIVALIGIIALALVQAQVLLANYNIINDMVLTVSTNKLQETENFSLTITDANIEDTKVVVPLDENIEFVDSTNQDGSVIVDYLNNQLVIDWVDSSNEEKTVTVILKMNKIGFYAFKALTVRENNEVSSNEEILEVICLDKQKVENAEIESTKSSDQSILDEITNASSNLSKSKSNYAVIEGKWGTAPFEFNEETGELNIGTGELPPGYSSTPWYSDEFSPRVKKIIFTESVVLPENSEELFYGRLPGITDLEEIVGMNYFDTSKVTNMKEMFNATSAKFLDLSSFDTSKVTNMNSMFANTLAQSIDASSFDTSNVLNMKLMFANTLAQSIDVSSFNTSNVTNMDSMFKGSPVQSLDLNNFDTSNVLDMNSMFSNTVAQSIDVSSFNTSNVTNMNSMFKDSAIQSLDLNNFDTSNVTSMDSMFARTKLNKLVLGDYFKFDNNGNAALEKPTNINSVEKLTGKWTREDGTSKGYSPKYFMLNYGKFDLTAGSYVAEVILPGEITDEITLFNQTHSDGLLYVNDEVKIENKIHHTGQVWNFIYKTIIPEELTINEDSFKGYGITNEGKKVDFPAEVFTFDESSRTLEVNLKQIVESDYDGNYYTSVDGDFYYELTGIMNKQAIGKYFQPTTIINYFNNALEPEPSIVTKTENKKIYGLEPQWEIQQDVKNVSRVDDIIAVGDELEFTIKVVNNENLGSMSTFFIENMFPNELDFVRGSAKLILPNETTQKLDDSVYQQNKQIIAARAFVGDGYVGTEPYSLRYRAKVNKSAYGKILETRAKIYGTTSTGNSSEFYDNDIMKINVAYSGKLGFKEIPKTLSFKDNFISIFNSTIERKEEDWGISIEDSRIQKQPWVLSVKQVSPFESSDGDILTQVLIFRKKGVEDRGIDVDNEVDIYSETKTNPNDYFASWQKKEGFFLKVPPGTAKAKQYQTELQWNLKDTPI